MGNFYKASAMQSQRRKILVLFLLLNITPLTKMLHAKTEHFVQVGLACYYANKHHGRKTASGEVYDKNKFTAAHRTLPFGTYVKVTRPDNRKSVVVKINDRGPFTKGTIIDLSYAAAKELDMIKKGIAKVRIEVIEKPRE